MSKAISLSNFVTHSQKIVCDNRTCYGYTAVLGTPLFRKQCGHGGLRSGHHVSRSLQFVLWPVQVSVKPVHNGQARSREEVTVKSSWPLWATAPISSFYWTENNILSKNTIKNKVEKHFRLSYRSLGQGFTFRSLVQT